MSILLPAQELYFLQKHRACADSREWLNESQVTDLATAWSVCPRGDWMIWLLVRSSYQNGRTLRFLACDLADLLAPMFPHPVCAFALELTRQEAEDEPTDRIHARQESLDEWYYRVGEVARSFVQPGQGTALQVMRAVQYALDTTPLEATRSIIHALDVAARLKAMDDLAGKMPERILEGQELYSSLLMQQAAHVIRKHIPSCPPLPILTAPTGGWIDSQDGPQARLGLYGG